MLLRVCHPYAPIETAQKMPLQASIFLLVLRGYYYDTETELYFLKTRYYDPEVGRFISVDGIEYLDPETINGLNLYAYCNNNPVTNVDPNGNKWWHWLIEAIIIIGLGVATALTVGLTRNGLRVTAYGIRGIADLARKIPWLII